MYPSSLKEAQVHAEFKTLVDQRIPYHRKHMIYSAMWVPVTSLFTIVPLVPNIPLFYNAYRLWSHWKGTFFFFILIFAALEVFVVVEWVSWWWIDNDQGKRGKE